MVTPPMVVVGGIVNLLGFEECQRRIAFKGIFPGGEKLKPGGEFPPLEPL